MTDNEPGVIVVGAGAAGLQAAIDLARGGKTVTLLEARERLGGRILDLVEPGWPQPIELGAEFVHGGNAVLTKWIRKARLKTEQVSERHWRVRGGLRAEMQDIWEQLEAVFRRVGRLKADRWLKASGCIGTRY